MKKKLEATNHNVAIILNMRYKVAVHAFVLSTKRCLAGFSGCAWPVCGRIFFPAKQYAGIYVLLKLYIAKRTNFLLPRRHS